MATNPNSYAELVSLYFEGALSGEEKLAVYNTLGVAEEARLEFEAALFLQRTLDRDTLATIPASVEHDLFRRAGIALPMDESAAPSKRKHMRVAAIAFLLGALSVFSIDRLWSDTNYEIEGISSHRTLVNESAPEVAVIPRSLASNTSDLVGSVQKGLTNPDIGMAKKDANRIDEVTESPAFASEHNETPVDPQASIISETPPQTSVIPIDAHAHETLTNVIEEKTIVNHDPPGRFEISVLHSNAPRYFPDRNATAGSILDNSSIAVRYRIASDHWLGFAAGNDVLPLEVMQGKSEVIVNTLDWAGISYQLNIRSSSLPLLYPFLRETVGLSKFGLIAKTGLGVRFSPNDVIHAALGLEHTTMPVRTDDVMRGTGKLSLAYDITVQF